jgi:lipid II:glycine glycyltransferase (peptidoglycan interpeptide bridge formation enzyme)
LDELRANLHQKWRNCLNSAARQEQHLVEGQDDVLFGEFLELYAAMHERKQFDAPTDLAAFRKLQSMLPPDEKMHVVLCKSGGEYCAGAIVSAVGDVGLYISGATDGIGLRQKSSYLVQWRAVELLRQAQCRVYDLNGINADTNPGTYRFKMRLAGKRGRVVSELGFYEAGVDVLSRAVTDAGLWCRQSLRALHRRGAASADTDSPQTATRPANDKKRLSGTG